MGKPHDDATRAAISESIRLHHLLRTPEQKAITSQKKSDDAVCKMWIPKGPRPGNLGIREKRKVDPNTPVGGTTLAKIATASVKRILKDLVGTQPELIEEAMIAGLLAPPPRSFPYVALAAAYLDGKPREADPPIPPVVDLSSLSREELRERALRLADLLRPGDAEVIDATVVPDREPTLDELEAAVVRAQDEVRRAEEEVRIANMVLKLSEQK